VHPSVLHCGSSLFNVSGLAPNTSLGDIDVSLVSAHLHAVLRAIKAMAARLNLSVRVLPASNNTFGTGEAPFGSDLVGIQRKVEVRSGGAEGPVVCVFDVCVRVPSWGAEAHVAHAWGAHCMAFGRVVGSLYQGALLPWALA
jgi:hypothetical protein